jgi:hypothetical protein
MNWQKDKLTIIGFGIIFVILAVFGYLLWNMNREPVVEVVTEPTQITTKIAPKVDSTPVIPAKEELPEYTITKVDTKGWVYRETKLGDVGLKYKTVPLKKDFSTSLSPYGISSSGISVVSLWSNRSAEDLKLGKDIIFTTECGGPCGGTPPNFIKVQIIDDNKYTITSLTNLFAKESCEYDIIDSGEVDAMSYRYNAQAKCNDKPNYDEQQLPPLCVSGSEIKRYSNPFVSKSASELIQCKVVNNAKNVDDSSTKLVLNLVDRELFVVDLGNSKLAVVSHQLNNDPEYTDSTKQKINNLMHTILSTIEVL